MRFFISPHPTGNFVRAHEANMNTKNKWTTSNFFFFFSSSFSHTSQTLPCRWRTNSKITDLTMSSLSFLTLIFYFYFWFFGSRQKSQKKKIFWIRF